MLLLGHGLKLMLKVGTVPLVQLLRNVIQVMVIVHQISIVLEHGDLVLLHVKMLMIGYGM